MSLNDSKLLCSVNFASCYWRLLPEQGIFDLGSPMVRSATIHSYSDGRAQSVHCIPGTNEQRPEHRLSIARRWLDPMCVVIEMVEEPTLRRQ